MRTFTRTLTSSAACVVAAGSVLTGVGGPATAAAAPSAPTALLAAATSPLLSLPVGGPPRGVAYGVKNTLYLNGHAYDQTARLKALAMIHNTSDMFEDVKLTRGVIVWSHPGADCTDDCAVWGTLRPGGTLVKAGQFNASSGLATTAGGLVSGSRKYSSKSAAIWTMDGKAYGPPFTWTGWRADVQSAGNSFVVQADEPQIDDTLSRTRSFQVYPGYPQVELPDNTYAVGQGTGWLATRESYRAECYRVAPLATPTQLRARICSEALPMVSNDGTMVVVVQGRHVRLLNTFTGAQINATNAPTLSGTSQMADASAFEMVRWETATTYLVKAKDYKTLTILRCSATTRACVRAVTVSTNTTYKIVT
jgi:hypothetical protein